MRFCLYLTMVVLALLGAGCTRPAADAHPAASATRVEELAWGPMRVTFSFTPGDVPLNQDVLLDVTLVSPEGVTLSLPPLDDRLGGFSLSGRYDSDATTSGGTTTHALHMRLTPLVAREYRLAPLAVSYTDARVQPPLTGWFPTKPIVLSAAAPAAHGSALAGTVEPLWIRPAFRTVAAWIVGSIAVAALAVWLFRIMRRVREEVQLRRLSPRERALRELHNLLAKGLIERGLVKDFYVELTMIVRRYIERRHGVRAPEQTTEEFLAAVGRDPRFDAAVLMRLQAFLQAADRVKFAAHQPAAGDIDAATRTAEEYIAQDAEAVDSGAPAREEDA